MTTTLRLDADDSRRVEALYLTAGSAGPARYSAGLIDIVAAFVVNRDGLTAADLAGWAEDLRSLGPDYFFSLNRYLFGAVKPPISTG